MFDIVKSCDFINGLLDEWVTVHPCSYRRSHFPHFNMSYHVCDIITAAKTCWAFEHRRASQRLPGAMAVAARPPLRSPPADGRPGCAWAPSGDHPGFALLDSDLLCSLMLICCFCLMRQQPLWMGFGDHQMVLADPLWDCGNVCEPKICLKQHNDLFLVSGEKCESVYSDSEETQSCCLLLRFASISPHGAQHSMRNKVHVLTDQHRGSINLELNTSTRNWQFQWREPLYWNVPLMPFSSPKLVFVSLCRGSSWWQAVCAARGLGRSKMCLLSNKFSGDTGKEGCSCSGLTMT